MRTITERWLFRLVNLSQDASNNKLNTFRYGATMPKWTLRK